MSLNDVDFDFEQDVQVLLPKLSPEDIISNLINPSNFERGGVGLGTSNKHRIIVCTHWLLGLCHHGNECPFLHRFDKNKMKACKHGNLCKIKNCPLKHVAEEELEECIFYKQGFCCNGPKCGRRHIKRMPEDCPAEVVFDPSTPAYASALSSGGGGGGQGLSQYGKKLKTNQPNDNFKVTLCTHFLLNLMCPFNEKCHYAHGEDEINDGYQPNTEFLEDSNVYDPTFGELGESLDALPLPTASASTSRCSYFLLQSPDLRSLAIAQRRGVWAVPTRMAGEINAAFASSQHVIILFSVRPLRGIYGVARVEGTIPSATAGPITPEFPIKWLRSIRIGLKTVAQVKLGNGGMFIGRAATDGRFESKIGFDMLLTMYRKKPWNWLAELEKAEAGIRLVNESTTASSTLNNEYYPAAGNNAYMLPPDVLFAPEWMERAGLSPNEKGLILGVNSSGGVDQSAMNAAPNFYSGALPGFIFCATSPIVEEMFSRSLFGLPPNMQDSATIHPNVPLFIFDTQAQIMLGIFHADSPTSLNLEPAAFCGWMGMGPNGGSPLPVQLHFRIALEVPPVPINDNELQAILQGQAPAGLVNPAKTSAIANMFARRSPAFMASASQKGRGGAAAGTAGSITAGGAGFYKPPFKHTGTVPVGVTGSLFEIKKKLLGTNASNIIQVVDEFGGTQMVRIRIRGQGSGFLEGPNRQELPEPLHFNVSAENEPLLQSVTTRMQELVKKAKLEIVNR